MDTKSVINRIIASYFEPYEIAIATGIGLTPNMVQLCARDNWIDGVRAIIGKYLANIDAIIMAINHKNTDMVILLMDTQIINETQIIFALAVNDSPLLFTRKIWRLDEYCVSIAMNGASSVVNTGLMQNIHDRANSAGLRYN